MTNLFLSLLTLLFTALLGYFHTLSTVRKRRGSTNNLQRSEASAKRRHLFPGGRRRLIALAPPLLSLQVFLTIFIYFLLQVQGNHGQKRTGIERPL